MRKINIEQLIRNIVQDELEQAFGVSKETDNTKTEISIDSTDSSDEIRLPALDRAPIQARGKFKNRGRGRVTKPTDGRLKANKR